MHKYKLLGRKGEGTFSEVLKAQSIKSGKFMAIKCMKHVFESIDQVNNLREIQALRRLSPHPNIVKLYEVLYDQPTGRLALVFELMDCNIYELIKGRNHYLPEDTVRGYMYQLMKSVDHMHRHGIFHRDIKPENLLIVDNLLKLADFGSCRGIYSKQPYTEYISTRWYRAPECLLTDGYYGYKMDLWGVGCVLFETLALYPLFPGTNEADQIERIHKISGTPGGEILEKFKKFGSSHVDFNFTTYKRHALGLAKLLPHVTADAIDLLHRLLAYDPDERITARDALRHPWFADLRAADRKAREAAKARKAAEDEAGGGTGSPGDGDVGLGSPRSNASPVPPPDDSGMGMGGLVPLVGAAHPAAPAVAGKHASQGQGKGSGKGGEAQASGAKQQGLSAADRSAGSGKASDHGQGVPVKAGGATGVKDKTGGGVGGSDASKTTFKSLAAGPVSGPGPSLAAPSHTRAAPGPQAAPSGNGQTHAHPTAKAEREREVPRETLAAYSLLGTKLGGKEGGHAPSLLSPTVPGVGSKAITDMTVKAKQQQPHQAGSGPGHAAVDIVASGMYGRVEQRAGGNAARSLVQAGPGHVYQGGAGVAAAKHEGGLGGGASLYGGPSVGHGLNMPTGLYGGPLGGGGARKLEPLGPLGSPQQVQGNGQGAAVHGREPGAGVVTALSPSAAVLLAQAHANMHMQAQAMAQAHGRTFGGGAGGVGASTNAHMYNAGQGGGTKKGTQGQGHGAGSIGGPSKYGHPVGLYGGPSMGSIAEALILVPGMAGGAGMGGSLLHNVGGTGQGKAGGVGAGRLGAAIAKQQSGHGVSPRQQGQGQFQASAVSAKAGQGQSYKNSSNVGNVYNAQLTSPTGVSGLWNNPAGIQALSQLQGGLTAMQTQGAGGMRAGYDHHHQQQQYFTDPMRAQGGGGRPNMLSPVQAVAAARAAVAGAAGNNGAPGFASPFSLGPGPSGFGAAAGSPSMRWNNMARERMVDRDRSRRVPGGPPFGNGANGMAIGGAGASQLAGGMSMGSPPAMGAMGMGGGSYQSPYAQKVVTGPRYDG